MKNKMIRRSLGLVGLLLGGACIGSASTLAYYIDVFSGSTTAVLCSGSTASSCPGSGSATLQSSAMPNDVTLSVPKLNQSSDPNPGYVFTLTQVALALNWRASGNVTIYNFYSANIPFDSAQAATLMTLTSGTTSVTANGIASQGAGTALCCNVQTSPFYLGSTTFTGLTGSNTAGPQYPSNLGFYESFGAANFSASLHTDSVNVSGTSSDVHSSSLAYQGSGQMGAIMTIEYTFTESFLPEPATFATMGGSLLGVALAVRWKRRRRA